MSDPGTYRLVEGRHGRFLANPRDIYIGRSLVEYGEYSEAEWQFLAQLVPQGGVVVEAGANIGALTVPIARRAGPGGLVYAIEPQPLVFQNLCANLALNGLVNVHAVCAACAEAAGWLAVRRLNPAREANFGGIRLDAISGAESPTRIRVERLDELVATPRLDLIKADVEGMERAVLEGARELVARFEPALYVEAHDPGKSPELFRWIEAAGYRAWWHLPPMFSPGNHAGRADNVWGQAIRSNNVIALPARRAGSVRNLRPVEGPDDHPRHWR